MSGNNEKDNGAPITPEDEGLADDYPVIVIGASAGGIDALKTLISALPADFQAPIFIVWHMPTDVQGVLPMILNRINRIYAAHAQDMEIISPLRIYVAPPDRHMLLEKGRVRITRGPKENRFRPAVDPLFRSAAYVYRRNVIGIILSGALDDGTSGLWTIKHFGGAAIVQDPMDAEVGSMPASAMREVQVDHCLPVSEMAALLVKLVDEMRGSGPHVATEKDPKTEAELKIASEENAFELDIMKFGELTPFTCPECHGVLTELMEGKIRSYRCHTGHAFSADSLLSELTETIEESLYGAIRGLDEAVLLLNHLGDHFAEHNETRLAAMYFKKANEAQERSKLIKNAINTHEVLDNANMITQLANMQKKEASTKIER